MCIRDRNSAMIGLTVVAGWILGFRLFQLVSWIHAGWILGFRLFNWFLGFTQGGYWGFRLFNWFPGFMQGGYWVLDCSIGFLGSPPNPLKEGKWIWGLIGVV